MSVCSSSGGGDVAAQPIGAIADHWEVAWTDQLSAVAAARSRFNAMCLSVPLRRRSREGTAGTDDTRRKYQVFDFVFDHMIQPTRCDRIALRTAAMAIGVEKVRSAKNTRGLFP